MVTLYVGRALASSQWPRKSSASFPARIFIASLSRFGDACMHEPLCVRASRPHRRLVWELILGEVFFLIIGLLADSPDRFYDATCKIGQQCITATYRKPGSENRRARCNLGLQNRSRLLFTKEKCQPVSAFIGSCRYENVDFELPSLPPSICSSCGTRAINYRNRNWNNAVDSVMYSEEENNEIFLLWEFFFF